MMRSSWQNGPVRPADRVTRVFSVSRPPVRYNRSSQRAVMTKTLLVLIFFALTLSPQRGDELRIVRMWIADAQKHEPGVIDPALREIAAQPPRTFDIVCRGLNPVLAAIKDVKERNDVRRRGALLHTDIALLLPERAADFTQNDIHLPPRVDPFWQKNPTPKEADSLVFSADGEYLSTGTDNAHWWMAAVLLRGIQPHADDDPFVAAWSRAIAAHFASQYLYGSADHHLIRAFVMLPDDPVLLFYAGAIREAYASARIQSVPATRPSSVRDLNVLTSQEEWRSAEKYFRDSLKFGGPPEAKLRLARVKGLLRNHDEAAMMLRELVPEMTDPRLQYLGYLFLGTEEGMLGRVDASRQNFERAVRMQPTAQSPLLGLTEMYRRAGDLQAAQETLRRLAALPDNSDRRQDPYLDYFRSFAFDAEAQLAAVRASVKSAGR
jgi:tetratricopeptide (TPR) repeat protein